MASELAKAYVQVIPSAKGIKGSMARALGSEASSAGDHAGGSFGASMVGKIKGVLAAAGIGTALKEVISAGADLQQSVGGVETLFKSSADVVKAYADNAYKTAGVSANTYMETVTSFSASLLQSLGGDTAKAAEAANQAMVDMSDNANKMGTDMELIQNAYQGFTKQNFTMLDNLKLGYGGTKEEMERLLADAQKLTGVEYDITNLADVYSAIHVIQTELGITGTTAKEASTTITGSANAMKSAFENVLGKLALGEDVGPALSDLMDTVQTFLIDNLLPMVGNILGALPALAKDLAVGIGKAMVSAAPYLLESIVQISDAILSTDWPGECVLDTLNAFLDTLFEQLPLVMDAGVQMINDLVNGIMDALPEVVAAALTAVVKFVDGIVTALPAIMEAGQDILTNLIDGIRATLPNIASAAGDAIGTMLKTILNNLPQIISAGFDLISSLIVGIGAALPDIFAAAVEIVGSIFDALAEVDWLQLGADIVWGIINGIGSMAGALWDAAKNIASSALDAIKEFFGIASPSKRMRDEVGRFIPAGIAAGIAGGQSDIDTAMNDLANKTASTQMKARLRVGLSSEYKGDVAGNGISVAINIERFEHHTREDIEDLADTIAEELLYRVRRKEAALS